MQVLLVAAVWFVMWLGQRSPLPAHFRHFRMRLRGQITTLLRQRRCVFGGDPARVGDLSHNGPPNMVTGAFASPFLPPWATRASGKPDARFI